jgi:4-alpha-glucanotransferase
VKLALAREGTSHARSKPADKSAALLAGLSHLWIAATHHVFAFGLWHWRYAAGSFCMDRPTPFVYTGTHDNNTSRGWFEALSRTGTSNVWSNLNRAEGESNEIAGELIRLAWSSIAALAITPLPDQLNLGAEARMNLPGSTAAHWRWRSTEEMLNTSIFQRLRDLTEAFESFARVTQFTNCHGGLS